MIIPYPVKTFFVFPNPAMYCGQTPDPGQIPDPENSLSQSGKITGEKNNELRPDYSEREVWAGGAKNALLGHVNTYRIYGPSL